MPGLFSFSGQTISAEDDKDKIDLIVDDLLNLYNSNRQVLHRLLIYREFYFDFINYDYKTQKRNDTTDINEYLNLQIHENENFLALQMEKDEELRQFYANEKIRLAHVS